VSVVLYVLDTSYLIEIAGCGRDSHPTVSETVRARFRKALRQGGRFFVPLPCLFELGDHIADVKHDKERAKLAHWLHATVLSCLANSEPWLITPTQKPEEVLPPLMECFVPLATKQCIGLVDSFTAEEAMRLKARFRDIKGVVHIWTNDWPLKNLEPDREDDSYLWRSDGSPR
jgi:hypothetical protein